MKKLIITLLLLPLLACKYSAQDQLALTTKYVNLPATDGSGLRDKPAPLSKELQNELFEVGQKSCDADCETPFASLLGEVDQTPAYSNCQSSCIKPEYSFLNLADKSVTKHSSDPEDPNLHYIGVIYQCVEYARRWWMINRGMTFGSIDSAHEIIYLTQAKDIYTNNAIPLARSINGSASRPPARGDLVIYYPQENNPAWRYGHVAVVIEVDLDQGVVSLAEENYDNRPWINTKKFSRQIRLLKQKDRYQLVDVDPSGLPYNGGEISGWIYPKPE